MSPIPPFYKTYSQLSLIEELEENLIEAAVLYRRLVDEEYDLTFWERYISDDLLYLFERNMDERLVPLKHDDRVALMRRSLRHCKKLNSDERIDLLKERYNERKPLLVSTPQKKKEEWGDDYINDVLRLYRKYLSQFKDTIEGAFEHFSSGQPTLDLSKIQGKKIQTDFSVPGLAYFFELLLEEGKIQCKNKSELCRIIADTFATKQQSNISWQSLKNHFDAPKDKTISELEALFQHLAHRAGRDKEK